MFCTGAGDPYDIHFLKRIIPDERRGHLPRKNNHGDGIAVGRSNPRHSIGRTGAGRSETNPNLSASPRIAVGGMDSTLLMPHENMA